MTSVTLPRSAGGTRRLRLATLLAAPLLTVPLVAAMATGTDASTPPADAQPATVTLITGDVVTFDDRDGEPTFSVDAATRADGPALTFVTEGDGENFYVYPSDVAEFVFDGLLDRELFNVPGLIRQGLDDASAPGGLPVIVTFADDRGAAELSRAADALPMTSDPVAVEAINGAGVMVSPFSG